MATTRKDVDGMFGRVVSSAQAAGIDTTGWALEVGSVTYGRGWKLYRIGEHGAQFNIGGMDAHLGSTGREAYLALYGMARAFELVAS